MPQTRMGGAEVWFPAFSILTLDGGEWSVSDARQFTPGKKPRVQTGEEIE
jgi:hypothetical protein